jgi:lysophospholipase L1-like esterase
MRIRFIVPLAAVVALVATASLQAAPTRPTYLALGDSVSFGYIAGDGYAYTRAANFVGFPTYVGQALGLTAVDAACPGETSGSFISTSTKDNGCQVYRSKFPLHVKYGGSQLAYAVSYLKAHKNTKLVTIQLGANDGFLLEAQCAGDATCEQNGLPGVVADVGKNLVTIVKTLKATKFTGKVVLVNYYSLDFSDPLQTGFATALNQGIAAAAKASGALYADAFTPFETAAQAAGGSTCKAGLLNATPGDQTTCDVHPSQFGAQLLAQAVVAAYKG